MSATDGQVWLGWNLESWLGGGDPKQEKGRIGFQWADKIVGYMVPEFQGTISHNHPRFLLSHVEMMHPQQGTPPSKNEPEVLAARLTEIAIINQAAMKSDGGILHIGRPVEESELEWYAKLAAAGFYQPCDTEGNQDFRLVTSKYGNYRVLHHLV